jgi:hypothetical protein
MLACTRCCGSGSGGKSRRHLPGACLKAEPRSYVSFQALLVTLDHEQVIAPLLDDLRAQVALAEHGIAQNNMASERQDAQQFQRGFMLVGLGVNADLGENRLMLMSVGGNEMVTRRLTVATAPQRLTVERDRPRRSVLRRRR